MRETRRARWGVGESTVVLIALGDRPGEVDAMAVMTAVGLAREAGRDLALVVGPNAHGLRRALNIVGLVDRGHWMIVDERVEEADEPLIGCDLAIVSGGVGSTGRAEAAGLAVVEIGPVGRILPVGTIARLICRGVDERLCGSRLPLPLPPPLWGGDFSTEA